MVGFSSKARTRKLALLAAAVASVGLVHSAPAGTWNNAAGGSWFTAANWTSGAPSTTVPAIFSLASTYTVTANGSANASYVLVSAGDVTLNFTGTLTAGTTGNGSLQTSGGTLLITGGTYDIYPLIGYGGTNSTTIDGSSTLMSSDGDVTVGRPYSANVSGSTMTVQNGADLSSTTSTFIGYSGIAYQANNNTLTITGSGSTLTATAGLYVGYTFTNASAAASGNALVVNNGGVVSTGLLRIGARSAGTANNNSVTVGGTGTGSQLNITGSNGLYVGYGGTGCSLTVNAGGTVTNTTSDTTVSSATGSSLNVNGGVFNGAGRALYNYKATTVQNGGTLTAGTLNTVGGVLTINDTAWAQFDAVTMSSGSVTGTVNGTGTLKLGGTLTSGTFYSTLGASTTTIDLLNAVRTFNNGGALLVYGKVTNGGITKTGAGTLVLDNNANDYAGLTTISAGQVQIFQPNSLGATSAGTVVDAGASLLLKGAGAEVIYAAEPLTLNGKLETWDEPGSDPTRYEWSGSVSLGAGHEIAVIDGYRVLEISGQVSGSNGLKKTGQPGGSLALTNSTNDYTGLTEIQVGRLGVNTDALGAGGWSNRTIVSDGASMLLDAEDATITVSEDFEIQGTGVTGDSAIRNGSPEVGGTSILTGQVHLAASASVCSYKPGSLLRIDGQVTGATGARLTLGRSDTTDESGTVELTAANTYDGGTTVTEGTLKVSHAQALGTGDLNVTSGAVGVLTSGLTAPVAVAGLTVGGSLDVTDNDMIVRDGDASAITASVAAGRGDAYSPTWDQPGIVSSVAKDFYDNNYVDLVTVGVVLNSDFENQVFLPQLETFGGETVTGTDVLVKYTYMGDADLTGEVDGSDYQLIDTGYNFALTPMWVTGDFNYDGAIDGSDYQLIDTAYGLQLFGPLGATTAAGVVPEPASLSFVALGAMGLLARRRRM